MIVINGLQVNAEVSGSGEKSMILLHGWGQNTKAFAGLAEFLQQFFKVYNLDLPGFGLSAKPGRPFSSEDYADIVKGVIDYYQIKDFCIIGHSFGGRVAIRYASKYRDESKLVLIDSAGIVHKKHLIYYLKVYRYKLLKRFFTLPYLNKYKQKILSRYGSQDYKNADDMMKKILVISVNEDLRNYLDDIKAPVLLIWGTDDTVTPISDAEIMEKHLSDCGLVKVKGAGHYSYLENPSLVYRVLEVFLNT